MKEIEVEILSCSGRARVVGIAVPPYPEMVHITEFEEKMVAQLKVDGYNVRLLKVNDDFVALLRGGMLDKKTTELLYMHFANKFTKFFQENPKKVLCIEITGKKTMANHKGDKDIDYVVFDIMDLEKPEEEMFLSYKSVKEICERYELKIVQIVGEFDNFDPLNKIMLGIEPIYDGVVLKSLDGKRIIKYKWEDNPIFETKVKPREKKIFIESPEARIVGHFFQGYGEKELGLERGITQEELREYEKMLEELGNVDKSEIGQVVKKITEYLMEKINEKGKFDPETKAKIEKEFRIKIGKEVGKILRRK